MKKLSISIFIAILLIILGKLANAQPDIVGKPKILVDMIIKKDYPMFASHSVCNKMDNKTQCEYWNLTDASSPIQTLLVHYNDQDIVTSIVITVNIIEVGKYIEKVKELPRDCELKMGDMSWIGNSNIYSITIEEKDFMFYVLQK